MPLHKIDCFMHRCDFNSLSSLYIGLSDPAYYQDIGWCCNDRCIDSVGDETVSRMGKKVEHHWCKCPTMGPSCCSYLVHTHEEED